MKKLAMLALSLITMVWLSQPADSKPRPWKSIPPAWYSSTCQILADGIIVGSGVCVAPNTIATAAHVLIGSEISVQYRQGENLYTVHQAEIGKIDIVHDVAILHIKFSKLQPAPLAESTPDWGAPIAIVGCPQRHDPVPMFGHWAEYVPPWVEAYRPGLRTISAPNYLGNSGSPVWDLNENCVVGITIAKDSKFDHLTYVLPFHFIKELLHDAGI